MQKYFTSIFTDKGYGLGQYNVEVCTQYNIGVCT